MAITTFTICDASSRVGARINAWQSRLLRSMFCSSPAVHRGGPGQAPPLLLKECADTPSMLRHGGAKMLLCVNCAAQVSRTNREGRGLAGS